MEYYTFKNGDKYPISESRFAVKGHCGKCDVCGDITSDYCMGCWKWIHLSRGCSITHDRDETEGWS